MAASLQIFNYSHIRTVIGRCKRDDALWPPPVGAVMIFHWGSMISSLLRVWLGSEYIKFIQENVYRVQGLF